MLLLYKSNGNKNATGNYEQRGINVLTSTDFGLYLSSIGVTSVM